MCCPTLYEQALKKMYRQETGYERIYPAKLSSYRKKKYTSEELMDGEIVREQEPPAAQKGTERDIINLWSKVYKERGWDQFATFNKKGGFNRPYVIFKAKNITDPEMRQK